VNSSIHILYGYGLVHLLRWIILIGLQLKFINFPILNTIYRPFTIIHLNRVSIHIHIRCVLKCLPNKKNQTKVIHIDANSLLWHKTQTYKPLKLECNICGK
jgi:hypothetical protein